VGQAVLLNIRFDDASEGIGSPAQIPAEWPLLRRAIECVPDGVVITAEMSGGKPPAVLYANAAFTTLTGFVAGHALEKGAEGASWDDPLWESLRQSHQSEDAYSADIAHCGRDGSRTVLRLRSHPVRDESGRITHRIAVFRDVTEQTNLEEAVRRNERLACIGLLGAGIAHEINNPTSAALVAAETALAIKDSPGAGEQVNACLQNIVTSMDRCGRIVRTLLRYTRQQPTEKQACNVNDVAEQSLDLARPYGESHGAELRLELDPAVPLVPMNPLEIELVLVNMIRNAVEAGRGGVVIVVRTMRTEGGVRVEVSDTGCGMDEEQLAHVFDPLYTTRRQAGGSGLGMSIAQGIVRAHTGRMEVRSRPGAGTTVIVELPTA
jgi:two-component system, cell cycle sensor histidine kinase and response regulator CckA